AGNGAGGRLSHPGRDHPGKADRHHGLSGQAMSTTAATSGVEATTATHEAAAGMAATTPTSPAAAIAVDGLRKRFGGLVALDGVDLQAQAGEVLGIIGVNGAGKTTLMNCICGIYRADTGTVLI